MVLQFKNINPFIFYDKELVENEFYMSEVMQDTWEEGEGEFDPAHLPIMLAVIFVPFTSLICATMLFNAYR